MNLFLLFLSLIACADTLQQPTNAVAVSEDTACISRYCCSFGIETEKAGFTGMLLMHRNGNEIAGSLINEFGFSAFDFIYHPETNKVKLVNITDFLNKWYIRRVLRTDLAYCLGTLFNQPSDKRKGYTIESAANGTTRIVNNKRKLAYSFSPLQPYGNHDTSR